MGTSLANRAGVAFGAFYLAVGVFSFAGSGFNGITQNGPDKFLGLSVNPAHNLIHIGIGLFLIVLGLQKNSAAAEGAVMGVGLFYIVAFVIGVIAPDNLTILSMHGAGDPDNFLHLLSGVGLLTVGLLSSGVSATQAKRSGLA
jgi:Domain of unknown function (DUF4383)